MEKTFFIFSLLNKEYGGRVAGVEYSEVGMGCSAIFLSVPDKFIISLAKPCQLVFPWQVKWNIPDKDGSFVFGQF